MLVLGAIGGFGRGCGTRKAESRSIGCLCPRMQTQLLLRPHLCKLPDGPKIHTGDTPPLWQHKVKTWCTKDRPIGSLNTEMMTQR